MKTMRNAALAALCAMMAAGAGAGAQTAAPPLPLAVTGGEIAAAVARARAGIKPGQPTFAENLISAAPYTAHLEYRPIPGPAATHETEAEFFYVIDGAGTLTTGGVLQDKAITGGVARSVGKGDMFIVPEKTPHAFTAITSPLVLISMHMPRGG